ncbi:MAG: precorrin-8X methylmutase [Victivallales bacterium]|nr:precorrin-8X methylmutase [Victivallales bacterium]
MDFSSITWNFSGMEIEQESFRRIDAEAPSEARARFSAEQWHVARRLVHTGADFAILDLLEFTPDAITAGLTALNAGAMLYSDSNMIKSGISVPKLQKFNSAYSRESILCPVADPAVADYAAEYHITRALAAVTMHKDKLDGAIFLCGNAPLALAGVVRLCVEENIRPALIIAMPVGFVNVVESKKLLDEIDVPWIRLNGRRGGSPMAVAALHGIMENILA